MKRIQKQGLAIGLGALGLLAVGTANAVPMFIGNVVDNGDGSYSLVTNPGQSDADIEEFLGLSAGTLDGVADTTSMDGATIGSALKDTLLVDIGDIFSFDWTWSSDEDGNQTFYNDFAFASLSLDGVTVLADTFTPDGTMSMFDWTATAAGELTYGIGVMNVADEASHYSSSLSVSNISANVGTVPETGSLALLGIGLPVLLLSARRRRARPSSAS